MAIWISGGINVHILLLLHYFLCSIEKLFSLGLVYRPYIWKPRFDNNEVSTKVSVVVSADVSIEPTTSM